MIEAVSESILSRNMLGLLPPRTKRSLAPLVMSWRYVVFFCFLLVAGDWDRSFPTFKGSGGPTCKRGLSLGSDQQAMPSPQSPGRLDQD